MGKGLKVVFPDAERILKRENPEKLPIDGSVGLYARNLAMLKRTAGLVLLFGGACVDNVEEYDRLQEQAVEIDGERYPLRVKQFSDAIYQGLVQWMNLRNAR
jgi:hypothetical protein